jgi:peroxiredoxin
MRSSISRLIALVAFPALLMVLSEGRCFADGSPLKAPPDATARTLDGKVVGLADYKGKLVFLIVWKTDCNACLFEIPFLNKLQREYGGQDFSVIGLSMDRNKDPLVKKVIELRGIAYPVWLGHGQPIARYFGTEIFPTLFVIGPGGDVLGYLYGAFPTYDVAKAVLMEARALADGQEASQ